MASGEKAWGKATLMREENGQKGKIKSRKIYLEIFILFTGNEYAFQSVYIWEGFLV